jgi:hypothetical protein
MDGRFHVQCMRKGFAEISNMITWELALKTTVNHRCMPGAARNVESTDAAACVPHDSVSRCAEKTQMGVPCL